MISQSCRMFRVSSEADVLWEPFAHKSWKKELKDEVSWMSRGHYKAKLLTWIRQKVSRVQKGASLSTFFPTLLKTDSLPRVQSNRRYDYLFKILLVGDARSGKSNLLLRLIVS